MSRNALVSSMRFPFAPPRYLTPPAVGMSVSDTVIKLAALDIRAHGLELTQCDKTLIPSGAFREGHVTDRKAVARAIRLLSARNHACFLNTTCVGMEFDDAKAIELSLKAFSAAGTTVRCMETEFSAIARAVLLPRDTETVLLIDISKTATRFGVVTARVPQSVTGVEVGGHALTRAIQSHSSMTEREAMRLKIEQGASDPVMGGGHRASLLPVLDRIRDGAARHLVAWQSRAAALGRNKVTHALLVGDDAAMRGLPEYLSEHLGIPVARGDVFTNLAPRNFWLPPVDRFESLGFAVAIGLALRTYEN